MNRNNEGAGKPALAARIAIHTGPAVLDAGGEIFGDVANIAARAQALADPGGAGTAQVASLFVAEEQLPDEAVEEAAGKNAVAWTFLCTTGIQCKDSSCVGPALV